jgi:acyl-coenzyme A synthetase/AMP-(fatty) acid ligase
MVSGPDSCAAAVHELVDGLAERLEQVIPLYMILSAFIAVEHIPMTATGKADRRGLSKAYES